MNDSSQRSAERNSAAPPESMHLLIDENVPQSVAEFFQGRGHKVSLVREILMPGTPDAVIAAVGDRMEAIVVTWDKHFNELAKLVPEGTKSRFRKLGRITFRCKSPQGITLIEKWIDLIELRYRLLRGRHDSRLIVEISQTACRFIGS